MVVDPVLAALAVGVGLAAGFVSGLFGVGGGILMVPAVLYLVPGTDFHVAKAASLLAMSVSTVVGVQRHRVHGNVDLRTGLYLGVTGIVGAAVGVVAAENLDERLLKGAFGVLLGVSGARLVWGAQPDPRPWTRGQRQLFIWVLGMVGGVLAGFFGIGGGVLMVPALVASGVVIHVAVGTSLLAVLVNAWSATATNLYLGYWGAIAAIGVPTALGGLVGSRVGSDTAARLPAARLRSLFGAFLAIVGGGMAADAIVG